MISQTAGQSHRVFPVPLLLLTDLMELGAVTGLKPSMFGACPCPRCMIAGPDLLNVDAIETAPPRTLSNMKSILKKVNDPKETIPARERIGTEHSLHPGIPFISRISRSTPFRPEPYLAYPFEILHTDKLGIAKKLVENIEHALENVMEPKTATNIWSLFKAELLKVVRVPGLRVPTLGLDSPIVDGQQWSAIYDVAPGMLFFALNSAHDAMPKKSRPTLAVFIRPMRPYLKMMRLYSEVRVACRSLSFSEEDLQGLDAILKDFLRTLAALTTAADAVPGGPAPKPGERPLLYGAARLRGLKFHIMFAHLIEIVREYGRPGDLTNSGFEAAFKGTKEDYRRAAKRPSIMTPSLMARTARRETASALAVPHGVPDPTKPKTDRGYRDRTRITGANVLAASFELESVIGLSKFVQLRYLSLELMRLNTMSFLTTEGREIVDVSPLQYTLPAHKDKMIPIKGGMIKVAKFAGLFVSNTDGIAVSHARFNYATGTHDRADFILLNGQDDQVRTAQVLLYLEASFYGETAELALVRFLVEGDRPAASEDVPGAYLRFEMVDEERFYGGAERKGASVVRCELVPLTVIRGPAYVQPCPATTPREWLSGRQADKDLVKFRFWHLPAVRCHE